MKFRLIGVSTLLLTAQALTVCAAEGQPGAWVDQAREKALALGAGLKGELQQAIKAGGPTQGIQVCQAVAPALADKHSDQGWQVGRTSLRVRNPGNAPSDWQREQMLAMQDQPVKDGEPVEVWRTIGEGSKQQYEYMRAIPTQKVCLACHGKDLAPDVQATLAELYPADRATGFEVGDLRGDFVVRYTP